MLMQNRGATAAQMKITFQRPGEAPIKRSYTIDPNSRHTIKVDDIPGFESCEVSAKIETANGTEVIAERSIYFSYQGKWDGGHNTMGVTQALPGWYFSEGYTGY